MGHPDIIINPLTVIHVLSVTSLRPFVKRRAFWDLVCSLGRHPEEGRGDSDQRITCESSMQIAVTIHRNININIDCPGNLMCFSVLLSNVPACASTVPTGMQLTEKVLLFYCSVAELSQSDGFPHVKWHHKLKMK